jgi:hypothetical protein
MKARLNQRLIDVIPLEGLIPAKLNMYDDKNIMNAAKIYVQDLHDDTSSTIRADLLIWRQQWSQNTIQKLNYALDSLSHRTNLRPNINTYTIIRHITSYLFHSEKNVFIT